jgi:succinyl-diaminopimelate desuccinylase
MPNQKKIVDMNVLALAKQLVGLASVTPDDAGCQTLLAQILRDAGFAIEHLRFGDTSNLWATHGQGAPIFAFVGHTDVVPPGPIELWTSDPFQPVERDGVLYGRGAADMKAAVAAMTLAAADFVKARPDHQGTVVVLLTSDEEGSAENGIKQVMPWLQKRGQRIDFCLIGEPSSEQKLGDRIRIGRRGSLHGYLTIKGIQGHVAYPDKARNPIHQSAAAIAQLANTVFDQGNAHFPPTSFQIYEAQAGTGANNVIPGEYKLSFNFRFGTASTADSLEAAVRAILDAHGLTYELTMRLSSAAFLTKETNLILAVQDACRSVLQTEPELDTGGGTSDGRFIAPTGAQVVELGVLNATIHKVNEGVEVAMLEPLRQVYARIIAQLLE